MKEGFYVAMDTETVYSKKEGYSISKMTVRQYVEHPKFRCYLVSLAIEPSVAEKFGVDVNGWEKTEFVTQDGEKVELLATARKPEEFDWTQFDGVTFVIHNSLFDTHVFNRMFELGQIPRFEFDSVDTADLAAFLGVQRNLKSAMKHLMGVEVSKQVRADMDGKTPEMLGPDELDALYRYGTDDSIHCYELWRCFGSRWPSVERTVSKVNREAIIRGINIDVDLVETGLAHLKKLRADAESRLPWVIAENPDDRYPAASLPALAKWLNSHGYQIPKSFNKNGNDFMDWKKTLDPEKDAELLGILDARITVTGTSPHIARLETILAQIDKDGKLHPEFRYFGCHSGRFSAGVSEESEGAKNVNLLNTPRKPVYGVDMRAVYIPPKGYKFVIADLSQIEARLLLWLVDDTETCEKLIDGKTNLYQLTAERMGWCEPGSDIKHNNPKLYLMAKSCVLALGYSMSAWTFLLRLEATGVDVESVPRSQWTEDDLYGCDFIFRKQAFLNPKDQKDEFRCGQVIWVRRIVEQWRSANWRIAGKIDPESGFRVGGLWRDLQATLTRSAASKAPKFWFDLPGGWRKVYHDPQVRFNTGTSELSSGRSRYYMARAVQGGRITILNGGKLTENIIQTIGRILLGNMIAEIHDKHPTWIYEFSVYDEIVVSVPEDEAEAALPEMIHIMTAGDYIKDWTQGLPLGAEGEIAEHYMK